MRIVTICYCKIWNSKIMLFCLIKLHFQQDFNNKEEFIQQMDFFHQNDILSIQKSLENLSSKRKEEQDFERIIKANKV